MSASSIWRDERNARSRARLERALPEVFPAGVLNFALSRPFIPPTPRRAVENFWKHHILRADLLARALARRSGAPEGWDWQLSATEDDGRPASFRAPPAPWRETAFAKGPGHCRICGQAVYKLGWHIDLWGAGEPNRRAQWHACCVAAWDLWNAPSDYVKALKVRQGRRCLATGKRLAKDAEVDHRTPLYRVWRDHRAHGWPQLLDFWGLPNLQVINRAAHADKSGQESGERASLRAA